MGVIMVLEKVKMVCWNGMNWSWMNWNVTSAMGKSMLKVAIEY